MSRVHPRTVQHCYLPYRVLRYPEDDGHGIGRGEGEDTDGDRRLSGGQQEGRVQRGEGTRSDDENNLPLRGRVLGHVRLYGERGRGGVGGDRETGTTSIYEGPRASTKGTLLPGDACRCVEEIKTIAGGAVFFTPPPTPDPSTTSRTGRGGGNLHMGRWTGNQEKGIWLAVSRRAEDFRRTDDR